MSTKKLKHKMCKILDRYPREVRETLIEFMNAGIEEYDETVHKGVFEVMLQVDIETACKVVELYNELEKVDPKLSYAKVSTPYKAENGFCKFRIEVDEGVKL